MPERVIVLDHLKSLLFASFIFCCSLLVIGYVQHFDLIQLVADLVNALGFSQKSVGEFIFVWSIIVLPNVLCGVIIGKYVSLYRQLYISPLLIFLLFGVSGFMYLRSKELIWVCDSWNLLFVTAIAGFVVGVMKCLQMGSDHDKDMISHS
jgi:hypothetical protein